MNNNEPHRFDWHGPKRPKCPGCNMTILLGQPVIEYPDKVVIHEHCEYTYAPNEIARLRKLVALGLEVVEDFSRSIQHVALQDYRRYNEFCLAARKEGQNEVHAQDTVR